MRRDEGSLRGTTQLKTRATRRFHLVCALYRGLAVGDWPMSPKAGLSPFSAALSAGEQLSFGKNETKSFLRAGRCARNSAYLITAARVLQARSSPVCRKNQSWPPLPANSALRPAPPHVCGQALRYAGAWLRASWLSAISGASRPSASLGGGLRTAVALRAVLVLGAAHP